MVMDINQIWWACLTVETETPRETNSGISAVIRVVLPLPLHPARPKIRIISCPQTSLGADRDGRNMLLSQMLGFPAADRGCRPRARHVAKPGPQIVIAGYQGEQRGDP